MGTGDVADAYHSAAIVQEVLHLYTSHAFADTLWIQELPDGMLEQHNMDMLHRHWLKDAAGAQHNESQTRESCMFGSHTLGHVTCL